MKINRKVYVTRYALTEGILEGTVTSITTSKTMVCVEGNFYSIGKEVFETYKDAKAQAEKLKVAKIRNLKKQIEKLENLKF